MVVNLEYILLVLVSLVIALLDGKMVRYPEQPFGSELKLLGRTITCGPHKPSNQFPSETWSCNDLRVDGHRLIFTYFRGPMGASNKDCGETIGKNDIAQLCKHLFEAHQPPIKHKLWSAYVSESSCGRSDGDRVYFMRKNVTDPAPVYHWTLEERGKGYIVSLQCMVLDNE